jgi:hypothetical protein
MAINADKPQLWKADVAASVDLYNRWFLDFAPVTFQDTHKSATEAVIAALLNANDLQQLTPATIKAYPIALATFRMATAPPIARDRLAGLADVPRGLVEKLEQGSYQDGHGLPNWINAWTASVGCLRNW